MGDDRIRDSGCVFCSFAPRAGGQDRAWVAMGGVSGGAMGALLSRLSFRGSKHQSSCYDSVTAYVLHGKACPRFLDRCVVLLGPGAAKRDYRCNYFVVRRRWYSCVGIGPSHTAFVPRFSEEFWISSAAGPAERFIGCKAPSKDGRECDGIYRKRDYR